MGGVISSNHNIETTENVSGGLSTTGSFHRLESNTISVTNSPFGGSDLQPILKKVLLMYWNKKLVHLVVQIYNQY